MHSHYKHKGCIQKNKCEGNASYEKQGNMYGQKVFWQPFTIIFH